MEFEIYCVAISQQRSAVFFEEVRAAANRAAKRAGITYVTDRKTPDDESLPYALRAELTQKAPCILFVRPNNTYEVMKGHGKPVVWEQKFYELFKGYDNRSAQPVAAVDISILYTSYVPYHNQTRLRNAVKTFFPQDIPYRLNEFHADSAKAKTILGNVTTVPNIVSNVGSNYGLVLLDGSSALDPYLFPSDIQLKDYFDTIADVYRRTQKGEKIEDIKKEAVKKEAEVKKAAEKANPLSEMLNEVLCSMGIGNFAKPLYTAGSVFLAYQALQSPTKAGQYGFGGSAVYLAYLALTAKDKCAEAVVKKKQ